VGKNHKFGRKEIEVPSRLNNIPVNFVKSGMLVSVARLSIKTERTENKNKQG
jgi:hypothetical protein